MSKLTHTMILSALAILATLSHAHADNHRLGDLLCQTPQESGCVVVDPALAESMQLDLSRTGGAVNRPAAAAGVLGILALVAMVNQAQRPEDVFIVGDSVALGVGPFLPRNFHDLSISGATSTEILAEVSRIPASASVVVIECCVNDLLVPGTPTAANVAKILAAIPSGAKEVLLGTLPVNDAALATALPTHAAFQNSAAVAALNNLIDPLCKGRCTVAPSPGPLEANLTTDGLHRNAAGNAALAATVVKALH